MQKTHLISFYMEWQKRLFSSIWLLCFSHNLFKTPLMKNGSSLGSNKAMVFRILGFPSGSAGKESTCNVGAGFNPWVGKIPWRRERLPTPLFQPGEFHGLYTVRGAANMTEQLSLSFRILYGYIEIQEAHFFSLFSIFVKLQMKSLCMKPRHFM